MSQLVPPHGSPTLKPLLLEGAEREAEIAIVLDRDHQHRDVPHLGVRLQRCEYRPAVHSRHDHVERDHVGLRLTG